MTPRSPTGVKRRKGRYAKRMADAQTPAEELYAEYEALRSAARRVERRDLTVLDEILRPAVLAVRAARQQVHQLNQKGKSA